MDAPPPQEARAEIVLVREAPEAPKVRAAHQPWTLELAAGPLVTIGLADVPWPNAEPSAGGVLAFSALGTHVGFRVFCASTFMGARDHLELPDSAATTPFKVQRGHCGGEFVWLPLRVGPFRFGLTSGMGIERRSLATRVGVVWGTSQNLGALVQFALDAQFGLELNAGGSLFFGPNVCAPVGGSWCPVEQWAHQRHLAFDLRVTMKL
jgi:hypothetical protein